MKKCLEDIHGKAKEVSALLKILAHTDRMIVLCLLTNGEMNVSQLRSHSNLSQSAFSQHLAVLRNNKLVKARKSSQQVFYALSDGRVDLLLDALQHAFSQGGKKNLSSA
ncbi:MAG: helix-turn-helix transcriptional regulator [Psychromonas sp.]|nr:helix-turn-helix transcriptional regulator [Psychromonas sp.]